MKSWPEKNIEICSTHNEGKSVVAEEQKMNHFNI